MITYNAATNLLSHCAARYHRRNSTNHLRLQKKKTPPAYASSPSFLSSPFHSSLRCGVSYAFCHAYFLLCDPFYSIRAYVWIFPSCYPYLSLTSSRTGPLRFQGSQTEQVIARSFYRLKGCTFPMRVNSRIVFV